MRDQQRQRDGRGKILSLPLIHLVIPPTQPSPPPTRSVLPLPRILLTKPAPQFTRVRCTLGGEVSATVGPPRRRRQHRRQRRLQAPGPSVWTYTKSKGPLRRRAGFDRTIIAERTSEKRALLRPTKAPDPPAEFEWGRSSRRWAVVWPCCGRRCKQPRAVRTTSAGSRGPGEKSPGDHEVERPREASEKGV